MKARFLTCQSVVLIIAQPRVDIQPVVATYTVSEIDAIILQIQAAITEALSNDVQCTTGSHCRQCNSLWACSAASYYIINGMNSVYLPATEDMNNLAAKLSMFREVQSLSKKKVDQLEAIIKAKLNNGEGINNIRMKAKKGRLQWSLSSDVVINMLPDECKKTTLLTPTQIVNGGLCTEEFISTITKRGYSRSLEILTQEEYNKCLQQH